MTMTDPQPAPEVLEFDSTTDLEVTLLDYPDDFADQCRRVVVAGMESLRSQAIDVGARPRATPSRVALVLVLEADPATPTGSADCPECTVGKHVNCTGTVPAENGEGMVACACALRDHVDPVTYDLTVPTS